MGMTGASGGGFDTWMTSALDSRISVAVPVVATTDVYKQMMAHLPHDWDPFDQCHYVPGLFRFANYHELLAMVAPKPLLFINSTEDGGVPVTGAREVAAYGAKLYQSYGAADRIRFYEDSVLGHGYQQSKREAAYGWFLRWLMQKGDGRPYPEPPTETAAYDNPELRCFPVGENRPAGPAMVEVARRLADELRLAAKDLDLVNVLGAWPAPAPGKLQIENVRVQRLVVASEPGMDIPILLLRPPQDARGLVIAVSDGGKEDVAAQPAIRDLLGSGWAVAAVDPRGIGELLIDKPNWSFASTLLLGQNFVWLQTWDLVRSAQVMQATSDFANKPIGLYARGHNASLAVTYLIGQRPEISGLNPRWFVLCDGFVSYRQFLDRPKSMTVSFKLGTEEADRTKVFGS